MKHELNIKVKDNAVKALVKSNLFRPKVEADKKKFKRHEKHKKGLYD
jgi:stalled ribosome alternative rescue factor ArfA